MHLTYWLCINDTLKNMNNYWFSKFHYNEAWICGLYIVHKLVICGPLRHTNLDKCPYFLPVPITHLVVNKNKYPNVNVVLINGNEAVKYSKVITPLELQRVLTRSHRLLNSSPPGQNGRHFADDIIQCTLMNKKFCILTTLLGQLQGHTSI